jgi:hypothetical protein
MKSQIERLPVKKIGKIYLIGSECNSLLTSREKSMIYERMNHIHSLDSIDKLFKLLRLDNEKE